MAESKPDTRRDWQEMSKRWASAAPEGASTNDAANQLLIAFADIQPGYKALDLASGTGEPAISIALHVGREGSVTATDATPRMLETAKGRAAKLGLENITFEVCPMEEIGYPDNSFDSVTCRFGLMHAKDAMAALARVKRVLKPGRRAAFMVHGPAAKNTLWTTVNTVAPDFFAIDNSAIFEMHYRYSAEGELTALLRQAGFTDIEEQEITQEVVEPAGKEFWQGRLNRAFGDRIADLDAAGLADLNGELAASFADCLDGDTYTLLSTNRMVRGTA